MQKHGVFPKLYGIAGVLSYLIYCCFFTNHEHCFGQYQGTTLVQDGPGIEEYSVHCQVFAVLTGIVEPAEGKQMLEAVVGNPEVPQASVAFIFTCSARWNAAAGTKRQMTCGKYGARR